MIKLNKKWRFFVVALCLVGMTTTVSAGTKVVEDFEDGDIQGWQGTTSDFSATSSSPLSGTYSGLMEAGSDQANSVNLNFSETDTSSFKWDVELRNSLGTYNRYFISDSNSAFNGAIVGFESNGAFFLNDGGNCDGDGTQYGSFSFGETYTFEFRNIDYSSNTFDFYIDGNEIDSGCNFLSNINGIGYLEINHNNNGGSSDADSLIDDIRYFSNSAPQFNSNSISPDPPLIGDALDVSASASDSDGSIQSLQVEIFQDGTSVFSSSTSSGSLDINDAYTVQEGTVKVEFTATDDAGATTTDTITRTVSDTAPASPTINKPTGTFNTPTTQYDITVPSDGDDFPGESLTLTLKKDGSQVDQVTTSEGSTVTGSFQTSTEGSHSFDVVVDEPDGETSSGSSTYNVDFIDPTVDSLTVTPSPVEFETASDVTVDASDNVEVQEVCVSVDKDGSTFVPQTCRVTASSTVSETFTDFFTPDETNSDYTVTTTVTDNQGETDTSSKTFTLSNNPPSASGSFNPSTFRFDDQIDVSFSFSDPNGNFEQGTVTAFKDGSQVASATLNSLSGTLTDFFTVTETNSDYTVNLTATDLQGASGTFSETQTVSNQAPTLSDSYFPSTWTFNDNVDINFDFNDANGNIDTRSIKVFKDGNQIQSFTPTQNDGTIQDAFLVDETGSTYKVELSTTDLQGQTASGSTSQFVDNTAPVAALNATPETWFYQDQIDLEYGITDNEGDIQTREIRVFEAGTQINTISLSNNSGTLSDVFEADLKDIEYQAQLFLEDSAGQTDSESITQTITDNAPNVDIVSPQNKTFWTYNVPLQVDVSDNDRVKDESYSCTVDKDSSQVDSFSLSEGGSQSYSSTITTGLGFYTKSVSCSDDEGNTGTNSSDFTVQDFEINTSEESAAGQVYETTDQGFTGQVYQGDMIQEVDFNLYWNGSQVNTENLSMDGKGTLKETLTYTIPLVQSNQTVVDWNWNYSVQREKLDGSTVTEEYTSTLRNQEILQAFLPNEINLEFDFGETNRTLERHPFNVELKVEDNGVSREDVSLTADSTFENQTKTGFNIEYVPSNVDSQVNRDVTGNLYVQFQEKNLSRSYKENIFKVDPVNLNENSNGQEVLNLQFFKEEEMNTPVKADYGMNFDTTTSAGYLDENFGFNGSAETKKLYLEPSYADVLVTGPIVYDADNFRGREYRVFNQSLGGTTLTQDLFLINETVGEPVYFTVTDQSGEPVQGILEILRYQPGNDRFTTVSRNKLDENGETITYLDIDDTYYSYKVINDQGQIIREFDESLISCNSLPCEEFLQVSEGQVEYFDTLQGFQYNCGAKQDEDGNFSGISCDVDHVNDIMQNASLTVSKSDGLYQEEVCRDTTNTPGTLSCTVNDTENTISYTLRGSADGFTYTLDTGSESFKTDFYGESTPIFAGLVFLMISFIGGTKNYGTAILFSVAGVIVSFSLGFLTISLASAGGLVVVGLFYIFLNNQR